MKILLLILLSLSLLFAKVNSGDMLPSLALIDQYDDKVMVADDSTLIISFQKNVSSHIQAYLASKPKHFLEQNNILYISDMSAAPKFMIKLFAVPKMQKFTYKIALIYDDDIANNIQREEDKVTVIKLKGYKIIDIQFIYSKDLNRLLDN